MNADRAKLIQGLESLNKFFLNYGAPDDLARIDLRRTLTAVAPQQTALYDPVLERVPGALQAFAKGDIDPSSQLFKDIAYLETKERKAANWGYGIESHHPNELISQYVAAGNLSMLDALGFYDIGRQSGLHLGTERAHQYGLTKPGHVAAHTNLRTQSTGSFGSNENTAAKFRHPNTYERAEAWIPAAMKEAEFSRLAYNLPQEVEARRIAAKLVGVTPEQLTSTLRDPNQKKGGERTYANTYRSKLPEPIMKGIIDTTYRNGNPEIVIPQVELFTPSSGRNKGQTRAVPVKDPESGELDRLIKTVRPGELRILEELGFKL